MKSGGARPGPGGNVHVRKSARRSYFDYRGSGAMMKYFWQIVSLGEPGSEPSPIKFRLKIQSYSSRSISDTEEAVDFGFDFGAPDMNYNIKG